MSQADFTVGNMPELIKFGPLAALRRYASIYAPPAHHFRLMLQDGREFSIRSARKDCLRTISAITTRGDELDFDDDFVAMVLLVVDALPPLEYAKR